MGERDLLQLDCKHAFCIACLLRQLTARWSGVRVTFNYLHCSLCRQQLAHREIAVPMQAHLAFKHRVELIAQGKFQEEDAFGEWVKQSASRYPTHREIINEAMATMMIFMCSTCNEPYCGGRASCAEQQDLSLDKLRCTSCEWKVQACVDDNRCMKHGHRYAVFKCDFCCDVALYRCYGTTNFCERCHRQAGSQIVYPCPGVESCSLSIPHPCIGTEDGGGALRSFVLGCTACHGYDCAATACWTEGEFGLQERAWNHFTGGDILLAALGEREVRQQLQLQHPSAPQSDAALACAERLLLLKLGLQSPMDVLSAPGGDAASLKRRLEAVGLRTGGSTLQCASRLLLLLDKPLEAVGIDSFADLDDDALPPLEDINDCEEWSSLNGTFGDDRLPLLECGHGKPVWKALLLAVPFALALSLFFVTVEMSS